MLEVQALGFVLNRSPLKQIHFRRATRRLDAPSSADALSLLDTWRELLPRGGMVIGRHFPSRRFAALLPGAMLLERKPHDFRVRLAGFATFCFHGYDLAGRWLKEIHGPDHRARRAELDEVLRGQPHVLHTSLHFEDETVLEREVLALPLLASDARTGLVLTTSFWTSRAWLH